MSTTIEATFDRHLFRPSEPLGLPPNTHVRLTIEEFPDKPVSFLRTAQSLRLEGRPDWATNLDACLYGEGNSGGQ
jgi:hypothetical protein